MEKPNITQKHLDNLKPIVEKILSDMYKQKITLEHYKIEEN